MSNDEGPPSYHSSGDAECTSSFVIGASFVILVSSFVILNVGRPRNTIVRIMPVPLSQLWPVATYVLGKKLRGVKRYPLVLMLEPLFRCNLACAGCGKIQHPSGVLRRHLTPEQCFRAADECGAPVVSIPGGEPLLHPQIDEIVAGL